MTDRRGRFWLPALAVLAVCSVAFMAGRRQGVRPGRGEGAEGETLADLRDEVAGLRARVRSSEALAGAAAMAAAQRARPAEGAAAPAAVNGGLPDVARPPELSQAEVDRRTDQRFLGEVRDPAWSAEAEGIARRQVALATPAGTELRDLDCRSTMCRATLVFPSRAAHDQASELLLKNVTKAEWTHGGLIGPIPGGPPDGRLEQMEYLFRDGQNPVRAIYQEEQDRLAAAGQN